MLDKFKDGDVAVIKGEGYILQDGRACKISVANFTDWESSESLKEGYTFTLKGVHYVVRDGKIVIQTS